MQKSTLIKMSKDIQQSERNYKAFGKVLLPYAQSPKYDFDQLAPIAILINKDNNGTPRQEKALAYLSKNPALFVELYKKFIELIKGRSVLCYYKHKQHSVWTAKQYEYFKKHATEGSEKKQAFIKDKIAEYEKSHSEKNPTQPKVAKAKSHTYRKHAKKPLAQPKVEYKNANIVNNVGGNKMAFYNVKNATIEQNANGDFVLKAGSVVAQFSGNYASNNPKVVALRDSNSTQNANGTYTITSDIVCKSASCAVSMVYGASKNGNAILGLASTGTRQKQAQKQPTQPTTPTQPAQPTQAQVQVQPAQTEGEGTDTQQEKPTHEKPAKKQVNTQMQFKIDTINKIKQFCKDFEWQPDNRMLNTMYYESNPTEYLLNAMELTFSSANDCIYDTAKLTFDKIEWKDLMKDFKSLPTTHSKTNNRLSIYYGEAGTGKTEKACYEYGVKTRINANDPSFVENKNVKKIVANKTQDPADLFTYFDPKTKAYELTEIGEAMKNGYPIIIDEANLYNSACFQRLQGVLDNTSSLSERGINIEIKDGFKVVMTLNLTTNVDGKRPLPNPIVSRASEIRNFNSREFIEKSYAFIL